MSKKIKSVRRFNHHFKSFTFSDAREMAEQEYLESLLEYDASGNIITEIKYSDDGEMEDKNSYTYDSNGKLIEHVLLYAVEDVTEKRILKRDEKGRLIEEVKLYGDDEGERTTYSYDENDNLVERNYFDEEGTFASKEVFKYDEKGSLSEQIKYNSEEKIEERSVFSNPDEKTIEQKDYDEKNSLVTRTVLKFDETGKELSSEQTTPDGKLISGATTVYDEKGNATERHYKDFYSKTVRYQYDENNRCIMQELFDGNGLLMRKNIYGFDQDGNLVAEQTYEMDTTRGGRDKHFETRLEYEFW
jgi:YD repeat-containing protein